MSVGKKVLHKKMKPSCFRNHEQGCAAALLLFSSYASFSLAFLCHIL